MRDLEYKKIILPNFPRTRHLPFEPCASSDDRIASLEEFDALVSSGLNIAIEEKVDGANSGFTIMDGQPVIRNRNHILSKNYSSRNTPAKMQFAPIWNWFYENRDKFEALEAILGFKPCVYGEWLYAKHTVNYDQLPSWFVAFDVYDYESRKYISPKRYRPALIESGFNIVPEMEFQEITEESLKNMRDTNTTFSKNEKKEGIYLKACDGDFIVERLKMVRPNFIQGEHWNKKQLVKNGMVK